MIRPEPAPSSPASAVTSPPIVVPPSPPQPFEEQVRWLPGPSRALLQRERDVLVLDPTKPAPLVLAPGGAVSYAEASLDGALLGVAAGEKLYVYRTADGTKLQEMPCPQGSPEVVLRSRMLTFRSDGKLVAARCDKLQVFEVESGKLLSTIKAYPTQIAFHADSGALVAARPEELLVFDGKQFERQGEALSLTTKGNVNSDLSPDGRFLAVTSLTYGDETPAFKPYLLQVASRKEMGVLQDGASDFIGTTFSPDGSALFVANTAHWTKVVAPSTMQTRVRASTPPTSGYEPSVSADGSRAFIFSEPGSWVVDVKTGKTISKLSERAYQPNQISPDGAWLLEPGLPGAILRATNDGKVVLRFGETPWVAVQGEEEPIPPAPERKTELTSLSWMSDNRHLLVWGERIAWRMDVEDGKLEEIAANLTPLVALHSAPPGGILLAGQRGAELRKAEDGSLIQEIKAYIKGDEVTSAAAISVDRKLFAYAGQRIVVRDTATNQRLVDRPLEMHQPWSMAFTPDNEALIVVGPASFLVLEARTGKQLGNEHNTGTGATFPCLASPDGRWVGAGSGDGHVASVWSSYPFRHVINLASAKDCQNHTAAYFSEDGRFATAWSNGEYQLTFDTSTWKIVGRVRPADPEFRNYSQDHDNKVAAIPGDDSHPARLVEVSTGRTLARLEGNPRGNLFFSENGRWIAELDGTTVVVRAAKDGKIVKKMATEKP